MSFASVQANTSAARTTSTPHVLARVLARLSCAVLGHQVDNHVSARAAADERRCRCGTEYLRKDGSVTHVRHTLSCFLGHHTYTRLAERHGCHEYVCVQCGHPLLFRAGDDPYADEQLFAKRVRYLCAITGHRVSAVASRNGFVEYACHCGHSFLQTQAGRSTIHHPMVCRLRGHWIQYVTGRAGFAEYICRACGHPFCFADPFGESRRNGKHVDRTAVASCSARRRRRP